MLLPGSSGWFSRPPKQGALQVIVAVYVGLGWEVR